MVNVPDAYHILLVEDEVFLLFAIKDGLQRMGSEYNIVTAVHGMAALEEARKLKFDLVITDMAMVGPGGRTVTEEVRKLIPGIKVIWMTAYDYYGAEAERLNVDRYLVKPVDLKMLRQVVCEVLGVSTSTSCDKFVLEKKPAIADHETNILILDDDRELTLLLSKTLRMVGFIPYTADTLEEGRKLLLEREFDILLMDIHMSDKKSLHLLEEVVAHLPRPGTQIVIMSSDPMYREICQQLGINFFMEKPVAIGHLVNLVKRLSVANHSLDG
jgi:DNA-binding NtrC family response regulator